MNAYEQLTKWDRESKIEKMDLEQIKAMMCPISMGDYWKCFDCKSRETCKAGQRVMVLLEEETRATYGDMPKQTIHAMNLARQAAKSGYALKWVMENTNCSEKSARQKLRNWQRMFPDIMKDVNIRLQTGTKTIDGTTEKRRQHLIDAINSGDPVRYYREHGNNPRSRAEKIIRNGLEKYPDIREMYERAGLKMEDEVSIENFLEGIDSGTETAVEQPSEVEDKETHIEDEKPAETAKKAVFTETVIGIELENKLKQLGREKDEIREEIERLEDKLKWLEKQQDAICMVKDLFDPSTAIGKSHISE